MISLRRREQRGEAPGAGSARLATGSPVQAARARCQRAAAGALFFVTGFQAGTWSARIPAVKQAAGLGSAALGLTLLGFGAGVLLGIAVGTLLSWRLVSPLWAAGGSATGASMLALVGRASDQATLSAALVLFGLGGGVVTVAQNLQGVALERAHRRPVMSLLFGLTSVGAVAGGAVGALAAGLAIAPADHFALVSVGLVATSLAAARWLIRFRPTEDAGALARHRPGSTARTWLLALMAFVAVLVYGTTMDWSAVYLADLGAGHVLGAVAPTVFVGLVGMGRLAGNAVVRRYGKVAVLRAGAGIAGAGLAIVGAAPNGGTALAGLVLVGGGLSCVLPLVTSAAAAETGRPSATAVGLVTAVACGAYLVGPPVVGWAAAWVGLATMFAALALPLAGTAVAAGWALRARRPYVDAPRANRA